MVGAHQIAPAGAGGGEVGVAGEAEHRPGIAAAAFEVAGLDGVEDLGGDAEDAADGGEELLLALVVVAVGERDVEQALEDVGEHLRPVAEHAGDAGGVGLEAGDVLAGEVEDAGGGGLVLGGDAEDLAEGGDLGDVHQAVGLGHLGAERRMAMVKATLASGGRRRSKTRSRLSPRRTIAAIARVIWVQIDMRRGD